MQNHLRTVALVATLSFGASVIAAIPAVAQQDERRPYSGQRDGGMQAQRTDPDTYANHPEYSNNEYYRTGNDEGYQDYRAKKQREKHDHQYRTDDDRRAHDYGYREGWSGRSYRDNQYDRGSRTESNQKHDRNDAAGSNTYRNHQTDRDRDNQKHDKDDDLNRH